MLLLALSTSTHRGSVAVLEGDALRGEVAYVDLAGHAEQLFGAIDATLARAGVGRRELRALACDLGPGSFTGVRVGVASAKGIALALDLPLAGVSSLEAMAAAALDARRDLDEVLACLDAKKQEAFVARYARRGDDLALAAGPEHRPNDARALLGALGPRVGIAGEHAKMLGENGLERVTGVAVDLPDALWIGRRAARLFAASSSVSFDAALIEPLYVRPPDAKTLAESAHSVK